MTNAKIIRESLTAGSDMAVMEFIKSGWTEFDYRTIQGGSAGKQGSISGVATPFWLKEVRSGTTFTAYYSTNGTSWTQLGSPITTIAMGTNAYIGLAVCSKSNATLSTAIFDNVSITTP